MSNKKIKLTIGLLAGLFLVIQCLLVGGFFVLRNHRRTEYVHSGDLSSTEGVKILDDENIFFKIDKADPNNIVINWSETGVHLLSGKCRVKQCGEKNPQVMGRLKSGHEYRIVIDSGNCASACMVTDTVVLENQLEIYPVKGLGKMVGGLCHLCRLSIGEMTIVHPYSTYLTAHYEQSLLGRTTWVEKQILLGLPLMRSFSYILIDNVAGEIEFAFAIENTFEPTDADNWSQYAMVVENHPGRKEILMVDVPIGGSVQHMHLDTGLGSALVMTEKLWEKFGNDVITVHEKESFLWTPQFGKLPSRQIITENFTIGDNTIERLVIDVTGNENPFGEGITLGYGAFKKTVFVLDFAQNILWIKKVP